MHHVQRFFEWLWAYTTNPIFPAIFMAGSAILIIVLGIAAFVTNPFLGISFVLGLAFGVPVIGFITSLGDDE